MKKFWSRVFEILKLKKIGRRKVVFASRKEMIMKGDSQQLQFNHYCGLFITSLNFACRDFNVRLKLCAVIKFRAKLKAAQLAKFLLCHDI